MLSAESGKFFALCVVATVFLASAGWIVAMLLRSPFTPLQSLLYAVNYAIVRIVWRARIEGEFPVPPDQGALIVCNHRCPLDPALIALSVPRVVHWMVAREYYEFPAFRRLLQTCGAIPVRRGAVDSAAVREAVRLIRAGELVGVFPEGRINTTGEFMLPGRSGAAMIAAKARATVVPCYIEGTPYDGTTLGCLFMSATARLKIGKPIDPETLMTRGANRRASLDQLTHRLLVEIAQLAGQPDYEPKLVGRGHPPI